MYNLFQFNYKDSVLGDPSMCVFHSIEESWFKKTETCGVFDVNMDIVIRFIVVFAMRLKCHISHCSALLNSAP